MPNYTFYTREIGPDPKKSALTLVELDNSLLFLSSSIGDSSAISQSLSEVSQSVVILSGSVVTINSELLLLSQSISEIEIHPLSGSNYAFVEALGTPAENALALSASYSLAKTFNPTGSNRFSLLVAPGKYAFSSHFLIDTEYLDVVSLTGEKDVYFIGTSSISITANDVYVRGIDVGSNNFEISSSNLYLLKVKNCKGGNLSFGGSVTTSSFITVAGTFMDCEGGDYSFGGNGNAYGTFINCVGGDNSFGLYCNGTFKNCTGGNWSFANQQNIEGGEFENCKAGQYSFATLGYIQTGSALFNCVGGLGSFSGGGNSISGILSNCRLTSGSFLTSSVTNGVLSSCINANNTIVNYTN